MYVKIDIREALFLNVTCLIRKVVYENVMSGYRVLGCAPLGDYPKELELNKFNNFSLSGTDLKLLKEGNEYTLNIELDENSKYPASYILAGFTGIKVNGKDIVIEQQYEFSILCSFMSGNQATNLLSVYPDFVQDVLNGDTDKFDVNKLYNIKDYRLNDYIRKVRNRFSVFVFYPICNELGIKDNKDITTLSIIFDTPEELEEAIKDNPYKIYIDYLKKDFKEADNIILKKWPEFRESYQRCDYVCQILLREYESEGSTRAKARILAYIIKEDYPELKPFIVDAIKTSESLHYDTVDGNVGLKSTYENEKTIAKEIIDRVYDIDLGMEWEPYTSVDGFQCTEEQIQALKYLAEGRRFIMLTGSAGTGKTATTRAIIRMIEGNNRSCSLFAPTGIAAKRLSEATGRKTSTIHRFLFTSGRGFLEQNIESPIQREEDCEDNDEPISITNFALIDECSMVSVSLMAQLLSVLPKSTNLIFICDEAQLPSIDSGNVVQDIIDSGLCPIIKLTKVFRYGEGGIATVATDARMGNINHIDDEFPDFEYYELSDDPIEQVSEQYDKLLKIGYHQNDILVLSPTRIGDYGSYALNNLIQSKFLRQYTKIAYNIPKLGPVHFNIGDKVINIKNNYHAITDDMWKNFICSDENSKPIFDFIANGEMGIIRDAVIEEKDKDDNSYMYLKIEYNNKLYYIYNSQIADTELGYSITVHKSQGSQAKAVILIIDPGHSKILNRNLLYVGFSRAQERLIVLGDKKAIKSYLGIQENKKRNTWLKDLLTEGAKHYNEIFSQGNCCALSCS